jgi:predicted RecA/RadA family phage recombinase
MSSTFVQEGNTVDCIAPGPGGVVSGVPLLITALFGVPEVTAAAGETFALNVVGVHKLPKATGGALEPGALAYWAVSAGNVTGTGASNYLIGVVLEHAGSDDTSVLVRLNGTSTVVTAAG